MAIASKRVMQFNTYACLSEINQRENNQDSYVVVEFTPFGSTEPLLLLAVADGMGAYEHSAEVSREVLRRVCVTLFEQLTVERALNAHWPAENFGLAHLACALQEGAILVDAYVQRLIEKNQWGKVGTTIVIAAICADDLVTLNLGDSPSFHYERSTQTLVQLTEDHTVANALARGGLISPEMVRYHEGSSQLEFFVGAGAMPRPLPLHYRKLNRGDLVLLCTDGISKSLTLEKMQNVLRQLESGIETTNGLANLAEALREAAVSEGESDNQTLIVWHYTGPSKPTGADS